MVLERRESKGKGKDGVGKSYCALVSRIEEKSKGKGKYKSV